MSLFNSYKKTNKHGEGRKEKKKKIPNQKNAHDVRIHFFFLFFFPEISFNMTLIL